jgi:NAD(P)-dependent dehydrogenase (short-subunit alcohol dehydrogenase family)
MKQFEGKIAVVTGGGSGMGRELCVQLASEGCHVALCDVSPEALEQTRALCVSAAPKGVRISTFETDVSDEEQVLRFRDSVAENHATDHINLLFNNAGIGTTASFIEGEREDWERTFNVCWNGVYFCSRAFVPMLVASQEGHLVNTSSVNGFWASLGPQSAHSAYSSAKFAVKGFTEALINDFRMHAPHVGVSLVMPGHVGTSIVINSARILGHEPKNITDEELQGIRDQMERMGLEVDGVGDDEIRKMLEDRGEAFRDEAPLTASQAATIILDGVRAGSWRILVGEDAHVLDRLVREDPEQAYEASFAERLQAETPWQLGDLDAPGGP